MAARSRSGGNCSQAGGTRSVCSGWMRTASPGPRSSSAPATTRPTCSRISGLDRDRWPHGRHRKRSRGNRESGGATTSPAVTYSSWEFLGVGSPRGNPRLTWTTRRTASPPAESPALRGRVEWYEQAGFPRRFGSDRCGWSSSTGASTGPGGRRSARSPRRSDVPRRRSGSGSGRP